MVKNIKNNNKGFTLIELLAVVVIMGVLMIVAIPAVTKYIERSKKDAYADTAKAYINSARYAVLNDEYAGCTLPTCSTNNGVTKCGNISILLKDIEIDQGGGKSPYNKNIDTDHSYVKIEAVSGSAEDGTTRYKYSIAIRDEGNNGFNLTEEKNLNRNSVQKKDVSTPLNPAAENTCK